jgi:hypothetical protein
MSNHGLFVGVSALALELAAKMARRSLASAARRAIADRWSSGVALVSPLGCAQRSKTPGIWRGKHLRINGPRASIINAHQLLVTNTRNPQGIDMSLVYVAAAAFSVSCALSRFYFHQ